MATTDKRQENAFGDRPCIDVDVDSPRHQESLRKTVEWAKAYTQAARDMYVDVKFARRL